MQIDGRSMLPVAAIWDRRLTSRHVYALAWLWLLADERGRVWEVAPDIARRTGIRPKAFANSIETLIAFGYVRHHGDPAIDGLYEVLLPAV